MTEHNKTPEESTKIRLAKAINAAGYCSRREAERLIIAGEVKVNGAIVSEVVTFVTLEDTIEIEGNLLNNTTVKPRLWLYFKPRGLVTTHYDPEGRPTVFENLPSSLPSHVISIGRLDIDSEGLLLITNSGPLARYFELPSNNFRRIYKVKAFGNFSSKDIHFLEKGVEIEGIKYRPAQIKLIKTNNSNSWFEVTITEGKNREIRKLFNFIGLQVNRLIRISYGNYKLGDMTPGDIIEIESPTLPNKN